MTMMTQSRRIPALLLASAAVLVLTSACMDGITNLDDEDSVAPEVGQIEAQRTVDRRFDYGARQCGAAQELSATQCAPTDEACFCSLMFDEINRPRGAPGNPNGKFVVLSGDIYRDKVESAGNSVAHIVNSMNQCRGYDKFNWSYCTAEERAAQIIEDANQTWHNNPPKWFLLNELAGTFTHDDDLGQRYREWAVSLARILHDKYDRRVIIFTWAQPTGTRYRWYWSEMAKVAHIGVEMYLSGRELKENGYSHDWAARQYRDWRKSFTDNDVPASRIILTEEFAQSLATEGWGRSALPDDEWRNALRVRTSAMQDVDFAGYSSYGWSGNKTGATEANRLDYMAIYDSVRLAGLPTNRP
jgi:hypothetical protein